MKETDIRISSLDAMHCFNALLVQIKHDKEKMENASNPALKEFYNRKIAETSEVWNRLKASLEIATPGNGDSVDAYIVTDVDQKEI